MYRTFMALSIVSTFASAAWADVKTQVIPYEHAGTALEGHLAWDDSMEGRRPAVLVVHEWWGLSDYARRRAEQLAGMGYVAFALDMYGKGKVTEHPSQAGKWAGQVRKNMKDWQARAGSGLAVLQNHPLVDPKRIAAIGYCFGGASVLALTYGGSDLAGVVSFHGSLPVPSDEQAKQIKAKILICHGASDGFISEDGIQEFRSALEKGEADWQMVYYAGARHSFTNPDADQRGIDGLRYSQSADRRSWQHMQSFFDEIFAATGGSP